MGRTNQKLDGSNQGNVEAYTGRCPVMCEQCFVNWGQQGFTTAYNILNKKNHKWFAYAVKHGWHKPKADPTGQRLGVVEQRSTYRIPRMPSPHSKRRLKTVECDDGRMHPAFLRVGSMSDSSLSPQDWNDNVREIWGDYCYFNSAIQAVKKHPNQLRETFHNVVITVNGGRQKLPPVPQPGPLGTSASFDVSLEFIRGSMGAAKPKPSDFLHPQTLTDIGLGAYEDRARFYRLRAIPTIHGEIETDKPIVITAMRFKSVAHILEFARRYQLNIEVFTRTKKEECRAFGVTPKRPRKGQGTEILVWSSRKENKSPYTGDASIYYPHRNYLYPEKAQYAHFPYVCDRANGSCKMCGLCININGALPEWERGNPLNDIPLVPFKAGYIVPAPEAQVPDYFQAILELQMGGFVPNSGELPPEPELEWIQAALAEVAAYVESGGTAEYFCESWNTHEDATTLTAYCVYSLLRRAYANGMDREEALGWVYAEVAGMTGGIDVLSGVEDLEGMWDNSSLWSEQFGPIS